MKIIMTPQDWNTIPQGVQNFIIEWKKKKHYTATNPLLTIGEAMELAIAVGFGLHHDEILHGTFNNVLEINDAIIGWDSEEFLDDLVYEITQNIKRRLAHTYNADSSIDNPGSG